MEQKTEIRVLKRDENCERAVLGTIMTNRGAFTEVQHLLNEDCFYNELHRQIYRAIVELDGEGSPIDVLTIQARLSKYAYPFEIYRLAEIQSLVLVDSLYVCAARLHELYIRRRFHEIAEELNDAAYSEAEDIVDVVERVSSELTELFKQGDGEIATLSEGIDGVYEVINRNLSEDRELTGTPTGFSRFDSRSGGLQKSDLIIIAGETSNGKTSLAVSMMRSAALSRAKVAMYSMEMKCEQIAARMMAMESGVPSNEILYSRLSASQLQAVDEGMVRIVGLPIYFDDNSTSNIDSILSSIRYMKKRYGIDGAVVDYLQILNVNMKGMNKEQQMGDVARRLKNLAKDLDIWIIALSQLNRDTQNPVPTLARLRDSGQIAEAADTVILVYRPEVKELNYRNEFSNVSPKGTALFDVAKGRNFGMTKFIVGFNAPITMFYELQRIPLLTDEEEEAEEDREVPF